MRLPNRQTVFLYFTACIVNLMIFSGTVAFAWTSPVIPRLNGSKAGNPLGTPITPGQESILAAAYVLSAIIAPFLAAPLIKKFGRKNTIVIFTAPTILCFLLKAFGTHLYVYYTARLLGGLTGGSMFVLLPAYLGEIADVHNRGILTAFSGAFGTSATIYAYIVGSYTSIKWFSLSGMIAPAILCSVATWAIPESPYYYVQRLEEDKAIKCLQLLRNKSHEEIVEEIKQIKKTIEYDAGKDDSIKSAFGSRIFRKTLAIVTIIITLQQTSGIYPILAYLHSIFDATGSNLSPEISTVIIGVMKFIAFLATIIAVERFGRRFLLIQSGVGVLISLLALGTFFYIKEQGHDVRNIQWLPLLSLLTFVFTYNSGLGIIPFVLLGEMFPHSSKSLAGIIVITIAAIVSFFATLTFPPLVQSIGMGLYFIIASFSGLICAVFTYFYLPETKGRNFYEIQIML